MKTKRPVTSQRSEEEAKSRTSKQDGVQKKLKPKSPISEENAEGQNDMLKSFRPRSPSAWEGKSKPSKQDGMPKNPKSDEAKARSKTAEPDGLLKKLKEKSPGDEDKGHRTTKQGSTSARITRAQKADVNGKNSKGSVSEREGKPQHSAEKNNLVMVSPRMQLNATTQRSKVHVNVPSRKVEEANSKAPNQDKVKKKRGRDRQNYEEEAKNRTSKHDGVSKKLKPNSPIAGEGKSKPSKQDGMLKNPKSDEEKARNKASEQDGELKKLKQKSPKSAIDEDTGKRTPKQAYDFAPSEADDEDAIQHQLSKPKGVPVIPFQLKWEYPKVPYVKLNVDGSTRRPVSACGGLIRDFKGQFLVGFCANVGDSNVSYGEFMGMFLGLRLAKEEGFKLVEVECDREEVIQVIKYNKKPKRYHNLVSDIRNLASDSSWTIKISQVKREVNKAADWLSRKGHELKGSEELEKYGHTIVSYKKYKCRPLSKEFEMLLKEDGFKLVHDSRGL